MFWRINSSFLRLQPVHTHVSLVLPSRSTRDVRRRSTSVFHATRTSTQTIVIQQIASQFLDKFTWMQCILEWARLAFKLLMRRKTSIMQGTYMTCSYHSHQSCLPCQLLPLCSRARSPTTTYVGKSLSRQSIVELNQKRIRIRKSLSRNPAIQQLATTFRTINT